MNLEIFPHRGICASSSFAFLEVIVACEVADAERNSECLADEVENRRKRTIYLHLKKFFRGTRFTRIPFLRRIEEKHREGDTVCISGKVSCSNKLSIILKLNITFFFVQAHVVVLLPFSAHML